MNQAYCRWYGKPMKNLYEHEQEQCEENGQYCTECPDMIARDVEEGEEE